MEDGGRGKRGAKMLFVGNVPHVDLRAGVKAG
jgi:hypothetical protein